MTGEPVVVVPETFFGSFKRFLLETNAMALAIAVVIGAAAGKLVTSIVDGLIMPIISMITPSGNWRDWRIVLKAGTMGPDCPAANLADPKCHVGESAILIGQMVGAALDFALVALVVFIIAKRIMKIEIKH